MTRVAIAGTGGLAQTIARCIHEETSHPFILLSRLAKPHLVAKGYQVIIVDYSNPDSLEFALRGVQVVISTVPGPSQFPLIDAAIKVGVQRFAPAEFEGPPSKRPVDALDYSRKAVLNYLYQNSKKINWTCFVCGVLYERFAPGGMRALDMGSSTGVSGEGEYMMNLEQMSAEVPFTNADGQAVSLCMTSAQDLGRFVTQSLEMRVWPEELTMCGERLTTQQLVAIVESVRVRHFYPNITWHNVQSLQRQLSITQSVGDLARYHRLLHLAATQEGRLDFDGPVLNARYPEIQPTRFRQWLESCWAGHQAAMSNPGGLVFVSR